MKGFSILLVRPNVHNLLSSLLPLHTGISFVQMSTRCVPSYSNKSKQSDFDFQNKSTSWDHAEKSPTCLLRLSLTLTFNKKIFKIWQDNTLLYLSKEQDKTCWLLEFDYFHVKDIVSEETDEAARLSCWIVCFTFILFNFTLIPSFRQPPSSDTERSSNPHTLLTCELY